MLCPENMYQFFWTIENFAMLKLMNDEGYDPCSIEEYLCEGNGYGVYPNEVFMYCLEQIDTIIVDLDTEYVSSGTSFLEGTITSPGIERLFDLGFDEETLKELKPLMTTNTNYFGEQMKIELDVQNKRFLVKMTEGDEYHEYLRVLLSFGKKIQTLIEKEKKNGDEI